MNPSTRSLAVIALLACACSGFRHGPLDDSGPPAVDAADAPPDVPAGGCGSGPGACNVLTQAGCSGGQACALVPGSNDAGVTSICGVAGGGGFGAACASSDGCQPGLHCLSGQCRALCCANGGTCRGAGVPSNARCGFDFGGGAFGVRLCTVPCDFVSQNCPGQMTCLPLAADGTTDCFASGAGGRDARCQQQSECSHGLVCTFSSSSATSGTCRQLCDPTVSFPRCSSFQNCVHVDMSPGNFGVCV